jgi:hypothetical protein
VDAVDVDSVRLLLLLSAGDCDCAILLDDDDDDDDDAPAGTTQPRRWGLASWLLCERMTALRMAAMCGMCCMCVCTI